MTHLKRFTTLPILLDYLVTEKLVLLDPASWDDKNDSEIILAYKRKKGIENLFALCFAHGHETIHHWKTFANGASGCYIKFYADKLIKIFKDNNLIQDYVRYKKVDEVIAEELSVNDIPFTKRKAYECESEYRVIWEGPGALSCYPVHVPLDTVALIKFSQQMPPQVFETIKGFLESRFNIPGDKIDRSEIYENKTWISKFQ
jgi:hypothetical protein